MAKITDIKPQKNDPERFNIFVDGNFSFGISAEKKYRKNLEVDQNISESKIRKLIKEDQIERLVNKAFRFLSYRPRSEKEMRDHLLRKGKLKDVKSEAEKEEYQNSVENALNQLKKLGQIDDKEFAKWWIDQRTQFKPSGRFLIISELVSKGVEKELIDKLLDTKGEDQVELAKKAATKKLVAYKKLAREDFEKKLSEYLIRRGFGWSTVKRTVDILAKKELE